MIDWEEYDLAAVQREYENREVHVFLPLPPTLLKSADLAPEGVVYFGAGPERPNLQLH